MADLICLAGDSAYGDQGIIQLAEGVGFTYEQLGKILNTNAEDLEDAIKSLVKDKMITTYGENVIEVLEWSKFQSEYQRQKPVREKAPTKQMYGVWLTLWTTKFPSTAYKSTKRDFISLQRIWNKTKCNILEFKDRAKKALDGGIRTVPGLEQFWNKFAPGKVDPMMEV